MLSKKRTSILVATVICTALTGTSLANPTSSVNVVVNGESINMVVPPVIRQGRTLVPVREISQALGYTVSWNQNTGTVYLNNGNVVSNADNPTKERIIINGNPVASEIPPQIIKGRTMVPIRVISEATGAKVEWNQQNRRVTVSTKSNLAFPNSLTLSFESLGLERVEQLQTIPTSWERKGNLRLGQINQTELVLELYEVETVGVSDIKGVFAYNNQKYVLNDLSAGTIDEVKNQNLDLQLDSGEMRLLSAIGAEYESQILVFNPSNQDWHVMNVPGQVVNSSNEGLLVQFPGRGLSPQTVSLIRLQNSEFSIGNISKAFTPFSNSQNIDIQKVTTQVQVVNGKSVITVSLIKEGRSESQTYLIDGNMLRLHEMV